MTLFDRRNVKIKVFQIFLSVYLRTQMYKLTKFIQLFITCFYHLFLLLFFFCFVFFFFSIPFCSNSRLIWKRYMFYGSGGKFPKLVQLSILFSLLIKSALCSLNRLILEVSKSIIKMKHIVFGSSSPAHGGGRSFSDF